MNALPDLLASAGSDALRLFWWPLALWTAVAAASVVMLRWLPARYAREQYELRTALLVSLPLGIVLAVLFRLTDAQALFTVPVPYELVVYANGAGGSNVDLVPLPGIPYGALLLAAGAGLVALLGLVRFALDARALHVLSTGLVEVTRPDAVHALQLAIERHAIRRPVRLCIRDGVDTPVAFGLRRPTVVVPASLLDRPAELHLVLLHETAHLAAGDFTLDAAARLVADLFGWHPLVALLSRSQTYWREAACDLAVIESPAVDRAAYARLLVEVASNRVKARPGLIASMTATPSQLRKRIEAMSSVHRPSTTLPIVRHLGVAILFLATVTFTACSESTPGAVSPDTPDARTAEATDLAAAAADEVFSVVEQMPTPVGGVAAIGSAISYPESAKQAGVEGRVIVSFVVNTDGSVRDAEIVQGVDPEIDAEALRVVSASNWEAGMQRGVAVPVRVALPVSFKLQ